MSTSVSRRRFIGFAGAGGLSLAGALAPRAVTGILPAADATVVFESRTVGPQEALELLLAGNRRWVSGEVRHPHQSSHRRAIVAQGQRPLAAVFSCIDSRVPPELVFDRGLGDIFVIRTGAHAVDNVALGSVEFGPDELQTPLILVLGHERCGAITATINAIQQHHGQAPGHIQDLVNALRPAYELARRASGDLVDNMVRAQTRLTVARLKHDQVLAERLRAGALAIVGARYDLDTGRVDVIA